MFDYLPDLVRVSQNYKVIGMRLQNSLSQSWLNTQPIEEIRLQLELAFSEAKITIEQAQKQKQRSVRIYNEPRVIWQQKSDRIFDVAYRVMLLLEQKLSRELPSCRVMQCGSHSDTTGTTTWVVDVAL